jgi:Na+-driven multidrug efflux pump
MTEPQVTGIGTQLLRYLSVSGFFITVALSYTGGLQGTGDTKSPLYISIISQIVVPIGLCEYWLHVGQLKPGHIWMAIVLGHFTRMALSVGRFRQGKWRNIAIGIAPVRTPATGVANREEVETQALD